MSYPICRHIKTNGIQCQSPQLGGESYCYFHSRLYKTHRAYLGGRLPPGSLTIGPMENRESIQLAISVVINALAAGAIETNRAKSLLYGLQLASRNAAQLDLAPREGVMVRSVIFTPEGRDMAVQDRVSTDAPAPS
jgi:hypothetical protein